MKRIFALVLTSHLIVSQAQARDIDWGELFGQVVGGAAGFVLGREACGHLFSGARDHNRGFAQGICAVGGAVAGAVVLGEIMKSGNEQDMNDYMDCHRGAYEGPIGQPVELRAGGYYGHFTPVRQYRHRQSGQICRVIRYEAYDRNRRPVYRSEIRDRNGRRQTVRYVEKFECRSSQNQWRESRYSRDNYEQFNGNFNGGQQGPPRWDNQPPYQGQGGRPGLR